MHSNPFEIMTFIVAPALLANSSSLLSLGTSNRFARTVDRSRFIYDKMKDPSKLPAEEIALYHKQLPVIGRRSLLLVRALTCFYFSVGAFAATAFVSLLGAGIIYFGSKLLTSAIVVASLVCGILGVVGLVMGTGLLVSEMWLALHFVQAEVEMSEGIQVNPIL